jgi:formate dehydrogenase iron-sulfur subunit
MTVRIFIPRDAGALAVGADDVAAAILGAAKTRGAEIEITRTGSRGLYWLEPMVELSTPQGRVAFGPVTPADAAGLLDAMLANGAHPLRLGPTEEIAFLKRQTRLTFARCGIIDPLSLDDYRAHDGYKGLRHALSLGPQATIEALVLSGLRGRGGAGFPTGIKWRTVAQTEAPQKYIVCNADEGDSGTFADRMIMEGDPFVLIEGMTIAGIAVGATKGYVYIRSEYPHAIAAMTAPPPSAAGRSASGSPIHPTTSTSKCAPAPAPMSAAKRLRSWKASRAGAAWCAPSRRYRPTRACSAGRPSSITCCRWHRSR